MTNLNENDPSRKRAHDLLSSIIVNTVISLLAPTPKGLTETKHIKDGAESKNGDKNLDVSTLPKQVLLEMEIITRAPSRIRIFLAKVLQKLCRKQQQISGN